MAAGDRLETIAIVGGTGPQGRGLAVRWALAGHPVVIGSRTAERAAGVAAEVGDRAASDVDVTGAPNPDACAAADIVVVALPYDAQRSTLPDLRPAIGGKLVVNVVNPMTFDDIGPRAVAVEAGSAAEECQQLLPDAPVVSGFHDVPARRLWDVGSPVGCDVLVCSDRDDAAERVLRLAGEVPGMRGVHCGPLRNSRYIEDLTPVLLSINRRYRTHAALRIEGLDGHAG